MDSFNTDDLVVAHTEHNTTIQIVRMKNIIEIHRTCTAYTKKYVIIRKRRHTLTHSLAEINIEA